MRAIAGDMHRRPGPCVGVPLPGVPEAERERVRGQSRWPHEQVHLVGEFSDWSRTGDSGSDGLPEATAIPIGTFADPNFPAPAYSVYEGRRHAGVAILGNDIERLNQLRHQLFVAVPLERHSLTASPPHSAKSGRRF